MMTRLEHHIIMEDILEPRLKNYLYRDKLNPDDIDILKMAIKVQRFVTDLFLEEFKKQNIEI